MSAVDALVLDVESQPAGGRSDCGAIAKVTGVVVEASTRPGPGSRYGSGGMATLDMPRTYLPDHHFLLSRTTPVCAPRRLGVRAIRWAIRQLRFEGATISGAIQLGNHVEYRGPISSRVWKRRTKRNQDLPA